MSTLNKQRFMVGLVFSFFLTIGFSVSLLLVGLSSDDTETQIAKKADPKNSLVMLDSKKDFNLTSLHAGK